MPPHHIPLGLYPLGPSSGLYLPLGPYPLMRPETPYPPWKENETSQEVTLYPTHPCEQND